MLTYLFILSWFRTRIFLPMPRVQVSRRSGSTYYVAPRHLIRLRDGGDKDDDESDGGSDGGDDSGDDSGDDDEDKGKKNKKNGKGRGKGKQEGQTAPPQPSPPAPGIGSIPPPSQGIPSPGASQGAPPVLPPPKEAYVPPPPPQGSAAATPAGGGEAAQTSTDDSAQPSTTTSSSESGESAAPSAVGSPAGVAVNVEPSPIPSSSPDSASTTTSTESASATAASTVDASSSPPSGSAAAPTDSASKAVSTCTTATSSGGYGKRDKGHGGSNNNSEKGGNDDKPCSTSSLDVSAAPGQSSQSPQPQLPDATPPPSKHNLVIVGVASALVSFTVVSAIIWGLWFLVRRRRKERRAYEAAQDAARFAIVDPAALPASMYAGRSSPSALYLPEGRTTPGAGLNVIYGRVTPNSFDSSSVSVPQFITAQEADALHAREAAANPNPFVSSDDRDSTYVNPFAHPHDQKFTSDSHDAESMYTMSV